MGIRYTLPDHAGINSRRIGASGSEVNKSVQVHLKTPLESRLHTARPSDPTPPPGMSGSNMNTESSKETSLDINSSISKDLDATLEVISDFLGDIKGT